MLEGTDFARLIATAEGTTMNRKLKNLAAISGLFASLVLHSPAAVSSTVKVQAGGPVANSRGQVYCTFNFVFTDGKHNYIGTADHCFDDTMYPDAKGLRIGDRVRTGDVEDIAGRLTSATEIGTVVVSDGAIDFALIRIDTGIEAIARVRGWGGPSGIANHSETKRGDAVLTSGYGLGVGELSTTRSRTGILFDDDSHWQYVDIATAPGDSGGPLMTRAGQAIGTIADLGQSAGTTEKGPTLTRILKRMAQSGYQLTLVTDGEPSLIPSSTQ